VLVRRRTEADLDECARVAGVVRERDGYPVYLDSDLRTFLATSDAVAAWVAEDQGEVIGHVALHRHTLPAVMAIAAAASGVGTDQLGVVARLLVDPEARARGAGRRLLETATAAARSRGLRPILDVCSRFGPALALYERCGWVKVGQVDLGFGDQQIEELVYLGPEAEPAG
jgi:GNAT superfamily N-acetyltransferase